ncbi:MAG: proteasome subunit beta [Promethearchaeota archaeon]
MSQIPTENHIKTKFLEIHPEANDNFTVKQIDAPPMKQMKTGTTTVALKIKDGVVMATDNRATMGIFVANKNAKKLHFIQDYMAITIAGGVADALYLVDLLKAETEIYKLRNSKPIGVEQTAKLLQNILYNQKGVFQVGHLLGGYTDKDGAKVYDIGGYGSLLEEDYASVGSGSTFAIGVLETEWKEDIPTAEEGINLAAKAVRSAIIRDMASGNGIDIVAILKGGKVIEKRFDMNDPALIDNTFAKNRKKAKKKSAKSK